jgi:hypothetical protein
MIFGVILTAIAFVHPIGPGLMLVAETPFDAIPFILFGVTGNLITYVPLLIVFRRLLTSVRELSPELEFCRPYLFCGLGPSSLRTYSTTTCGSTTCG